MLSKNGILSYYKDKTTQSRIKALNHLDVLREVDKIIYGKVTMEIGVVWPSETTENTAFVVITKSRPFFFVASSSFECLKWVQKFEEVRHKTNFTKLNFY